MYSSNKSNIPNKYKLKYLNVKNLIEYKNKLMKLYPNCVHDSGLKSDYSGHKITYGEMDYSGLDKIIEYLPNKTFTSFLDIGSGRGKLCLYMCGFENIAKSIGVELVHERHADALELKSKLASYPNLVSKLELINANFMKVDLSMLKSTTPLIWISNLCFDPELTNQIFEKISSSELTGIIACSKEYTGTSQQFVKLNTIPIKMSWTESSQVYLYKLG